ncbi:zinc finger (C3HC4-type RING finger) family protein [Raphanus sativus]|uniref:RING-type E3 ubiquitin transferase n=1 Tax=Raphanus sativus TaxID=3726 RepID=A0A6J0KB53_RAPSA|nr:E3 ubiquitin-protein ligase RDUF2 [Raphanus sativus]KAJ4911039.1 zinc finger (C3HC4-type RING finger) family protein [Raphanus sativus]
MPSTPPTTPITTSYWCYSCTRFVSVWAEHGATTDGLACPHCDGGFIEEVTDSSSPAAATGLTTPASDEVRSVNSSRRSVIRRRRSSRRPSFNPVIVLQGGGAGEGEEGDAAARERRAFEFYYDDGSGSGLRPLPDSVSEILMGSGFERLLEQLSQIEATGGGIGRSGNPPASKSAIESLPRVEISGRHLTAEANCAVCTEVFEAEETEAREMPCKHIFHEDCIVPWLSIRNSCPVCRFEIPSESNQRSSEEEDNAVGMTIWRLPGGGFAVGRFNAAMRDGERVLPVVLTEMDGGGLGGNSEGPRRISWVRGNGGVESDGSNGGGSGSGGRLRRMVRGVVSLMRRVRPNRGSNNSSSAAVSSSDSEVESRVMDRSNSVLRRYFGRNRSNRGSSVLH